MYLYLDGPAGSKSRQVATRGEGIWGKEKLRGEDHNRAETEGHDRRMTENEFPGSGVGELN